MIIDYHLFDKSDLPVKKAVEDFHYYLGSYYDITIIPPDNSKIAGSPISDLISEGTGILIVVNRLAYRYRENRDIRDVISFTIEKNPDLRIIKKTSPNYDLFLFTYENDIETEVELIKPKKSLIKRKAKKEPEIEIPETPEPIKVNFDADPYEGETLEK